jgi:hypothetical protein
MNHKPDRLLGWTATDGTVFRNLYSTFTFLLISVAQTPLFYVGALGMVVRLRAKIMAPARYMTRSPALCRDDTQSNLSGHCESKIQVAKSTIVKIMTPYTMFVAGNYSNEQLRGHMKRNFPPKVLLLSPSDNENTVLSFCDKSPVRHFDLAYLIGRRVLGSLA